MKSLALFLLCVAVNIMLLTLLQLHHCCQHYHSPHQQLDLLFYHPTNQQYLLLLQQLIHLLYHPPHHPHLYLPTFLVYQDGQIIIKTAIISILVLVTVGQNVYHNALPLIPPCYVSLILAQIVGFLINFWNLDIHTLGLVTLIFQIRMVIISGYLDAALHILIGMLILIITTMIVLI